MNSSGARHRSEGQDFAESRRQPSSLVASATPSLRGKDTASYNYEQEGKRDGEEMTIADPQPRRW